MIRLVVLGVWLVLSAPLPLAGDAALRVRVTQSTVRGRPEQAVAVWLWPAPEDRTLQVIGDSPDYWRASSVALFGLDSPHAYMFVWHLPRTRVREGGTEPYTVTVRVLDERARARAEARTRFYVF